MAEPAARRRDLAIARAHQVGLVDILVLDQQGDAVGALRIGDIAARAAIAVIAGKPCRAVGVAGHRDVGPRGREVPVAARALLAMRSSK